MPLSFSLSVTWPDTERPNAVITLVYAGVSPLAIAALTLAIGQLISG
jgi:hypothetical protein